MHQASGLDAMENLIDVRRNPRGRLVRNVFFPTLTTIFSGCFFYTLALAQGIQGDSLVNDHNEVKNRFAKEMAGGPILRDGFEALAPVVTYTDDVQPILGEKCANCHTGPGIGGHNIGTVYTDAFLPATDAECTGLNIAECSLVLIQNGAMPLGGGCTGDPVKDTGNDECLTQLEQDTVQAWIDMGLLE